MSAPDAERAIPGKLWPDWSGHENTKTRNLSRHWLAPRVSASSQAAGSHDGRLRRPLALGFTRAWRRMAARATRVSWFRAFVAIYLRATQRKRHYACENALRQPGFSSASLAAWLT